MSELRLRVRKISILGVIDVFLLERADEPLHQRVLRRLSNVGHADLDAPRRQVLHIQLSRILLHLDPNDGLLVSAAAPPAQMRVPPVHGSSFVRGAIPARRA